MNQNENSLFSFNRIPTSVIIMILYFKFAVVLNSHDRQLEIIRQQELAEKLSNARKFSGR